MFAITMRKLLFKHQLHRDAMPAEVGCMKIKTCLVLISVSGNEQYPQHVESDSPSQTLLAFTISRFDWYFFETLVAEIGPLSHFKLNVNQEAYEYQYRHQ